MMWKGSSCRFMMMINWLFSISVMMMVLVSSAEGYKNYTVGDDLGWYDKLEKSTVDYQSWAAHKTFSLGDFLLFNTDNNHTVVQTYNATIYELCDYNDATDNDTVQWSSSDPNAVAVHPVFVAVPLLREGMSYFFSSDYDGEQCQNGQRFHINVTYGKGLPESLKTPSSSDGALAPTSQQSGDDDGSAPDTFVPSNFNHPRNINDDDGGSDKPSSEGTSLSVFLKLSSMRLGGTLIMLGLAFTW